MRYDDIVKQDIKETMTILNEVHKTINQINTNLLARHKELSDRARKIEEAKREFGINFNDSVTGHNPVILKHESGVIASILEANKRSIDALQQCNYQIQLIEEALR